MDIKERLQDPYVVLLDGAMGTYLYQKGVPKGFCYDEVNLTMPELVKEIHREYMEAGAEIIETNTFGANRFVLEEFFGIGAKTKEINYIGARLAKEVAKGKAFVAGSIGPVARPHDRKRELSKDELEEIFREQIEALLEGGVDLLLFETYNCVEELEVGVKVAKEISPQTPIFASFTFPNQLKTIFGEGVAEVVKKASKLPLDVIGANCSGGPQSVHEAVRMLLSLWDKPVLYMPNAGQARFIHGKFVYPYNPEYFARYGERSAKIGAKFIGGCCGTTPAHIRALAQRIKGMKVKRKVRRVSLEGPGRKEDLGKTEIKTRVKELLEQGKLLSVEVEPPRNSDFSQILKTLEKWKGSRINTLNISDSPMAKVRMNPFSFAKILKEALPFETIVHMTCRDRNLLAIQSDLLGAAALGVENILALTGDPPSLGDYPFATGVYDLDSVGLIGIMHSMNQGRGFLGNPLGARTGFFIGASLNLNRMELGELERARAKIEAGANFLVTQPVFDPSYLENLLESLEGLKVPIIVAIMVLLSWKNAEYLHYEVPGIYLPQWVLSRMEGKKGKEGRMEGAKIAKEIYKKVRLMVPGVLLIVPGEKYEMVEEVLG